MIYEVGTEVRVQKLDPMGRWPKGPVKTGVIETVSVDKNRRGAITGITYYVRNPECLFIALEDEII